MPYLTNWEIGMFMLKNGKLTIGKFTSSLSLYSCVESFRLLSNLKWMSKCEAERTFFIMVHIQVDRSCGHTLDNFSKVSKRLVIVSIPLVCQQLVEKPVRQTQVYYVYMLSVLIMPFPIYMCTRIQDVYTCLQVFRDPPSATSIYNVFLILQIFE